MPFLGDPNRRVVRVGVQGAQVEEAERQPATLTFVIDVSGSMEGDKLEMVHSALDKLVNSLRPDDEVAIVTYSDDADLELEATPVAEAGAIRDVIAGLKSDGGTNAEAGLRLGYEQAGENLRDDGINRVVLLSDGVANIGETGPDVLADEIAQHAGRDIQLVTVGVGLRGAPWGEQVSLSGVADNTEALASGDLADDDVAAELAALTRTAADL